MDHDHVGFVSRDGSFSIHNVAVGTYILHVISPKLSYVPIRIDVGNQGTLRKLHFDSLNHLKLLPILFLGSIRARKLNILTLKDVEKIPYPLELEPVAKTPYFAKVKFLLPTQEKIAVLINFSSANNSRFLTN